MLLGSVLGMSLVLGISDHKSTLHLYILCGDVLSLYYTYL